MTKEKLFLTLFILILYSCKSENKNEIDQIKFSRDLKIEKIEKIIYPSKFGIIDYKDGFLTEITTLDTNGYVINFKKYNKEHFMKEYDFEENYTYSNNYTVAKIEKYNHKNALNNVYIDSLHNQKTLERKIFNNNLKLVNLIKYKYSDNNLAEYIVYDSIGGIESKNVNYYSKNKLVKTVNYDKFNNVDYKIIIEHSDNIINTKSYDKDDKLEFQSQSIMEGNLTMVYQGMRIYDNDTTHYKVEYTYQDSIFYKKNKNYKNNELEYVEEHKLYKRK
jgi:hypothetical protein